MDAGGDSVRSPSRRSIKAVAGFMVTNGLVALITFVCGVITARTLDSHGRGELAAALLWPTTLALIFAMGVPNALVYHIKRTPERADAFITTALTLGLAVGSLGGLLGAFLIGRLIPNYSEHIISLARLMMLVVPIGVVGYVMNGVLQAHERFGWIKVIRFVPTASIFLSLVFLKLTGQLTPTSAVLSYLVPGALLQAVIFSVVIRLFRVRFAGFFGTACQLIKDSFLYATIDVVMNLNAQFDAIFVVGLLKEREAGFYVVAASLMKTILMVENSLFTVLLPKMMNRSEDELFEIAARVSRVIILLGLGVALVIGALAPVLLRIFGKYSGAAEVTRILLLYVLFYGPTMVFCYGPFMAIKKPYITPICQAISMVVMLPVALIFIPQYRTVGAAWVSVGGMAVQFAAMYALVPRLVGRKMPSLWPRAGDFGWFLSSLRSPGPESEG